MLLWQFFTSLVCAPYGIPEILINRARMWHLARHLSMKGEKIASDAGKL